MICYPIFLRNCRLQKDIAYSGYHGDLGAHVIGLSQYPIGKITEVIGMNEKFIKERPLPFQITSLFAKGSDSNEKGEVTVDDATLF
ncbi:hypothetical protein [Priestia megaterium]|uniref:hypothetical protein n=1 Tax=Priestia megaterium TaxID=1404 RepID=UPI003F749186